MSRFKALLLAMPLGACAATTSFAPPVVNTQTRTITESSTGCASLTGTATPVRIDDNVAGAVMLADNFEVAYRCALDELSDGRQFFQVPSALATIAGLVGPTLGMGNDAVLLAGAGAATLNMGNSYYAPRAKAGHVNAAHRAVVCIRQEMMGVGYFKLEEPKPRGTPNNMRELDAALELLKTQAREYEARGINDEQMQERMAINWAQQQEVISAYVNEVLERSRSDGMGSVQVDAEGIYFTMVSGALLSVHSILGERLRDAGSADTKDLFDQLKALAKQHAEAEAKLEEKKKEKGFVGDMRTMPPSSQRTLITLENDVLYPKLQTCVLQARA